jgi:SAM-dependent methyltransferase
MTQLLHKKGYKVIAVEPVDTMRQKISDSLPSVTTFKGTSWSIPAPDNSFDLIMLAQCFHWFDDIQSLKEIHRVLQPGGIIVLIWNMESKERSEWVSRLRHLYEAFDGSAPQYRMGCWKKVFETEEANKMYKLPLEHKRFDFDTLAKRKDVWTRITSKSYIAILDKEQQDELRTKVEQVLDDRQHGLPNKDDDQTEFIYPHDTDMYWCYKK